MLWSVTSLVSFWKRRKISPEERVLQAMRSHGDKGSDSFRGAKKYDQGTTNAVRTMSNDAKESCLLGGAEAYGEHQ